MRRFFRTWAGRSNAIALYETAMRLREPLRLTWDKIDLKSGLIRLKAEDVKENWPRRTPIT
jgi:integrase